MLFDEKSDSSGIVVSDARDFCFPSGGRFLDIYSNQDGGTVYWKGVNHGPPLKFGS